MSWKHLLVHVDGGARAEARLDLSLTLARQHRARLTGLFAESGSLGPSIVAKRHPDLMAQAMTAGRALFERKAAAAGVEHDWWQVEGGEYSHLIGWVAICCRYADLAIFGQHGHEDGRVPEDLVEQALLNGGRPVLVVPSAGNYPSVGQRVLVAWTGSRESARAVNDAMPFLEQAREVTVVAFQERGGEARVETPPVDIAAHLRAHGVEARFERRVVDEDVVVADMVLNSAADTGADLTVMGAYLEQGFPHLQRSTTTRNLLRSMTTPVLLSH